MSQPDLEKTARAAAKLLQKASAGDLAALRRMSPDEPCAPFWRFVAQRGIKPSDERKWAHFVKLLALLTPTGSPESRPDLHDGKRRLGAVLCDGGAEAEAIDRPMLSEARLARLLSARGQSRVGTLERAVRMLARKRVSLDVIDLAWAVMNPARTETRNKIARDYYARLNRNHSYEDANDD